MAMEITYPVIELKAPEDEKIVHIIGMTFLKHTPFEEWKNNDGLKYLALELYAAPEEEINKKFGYISKEIFFKYYSHLANTLSIKMQELKERDTLFEVKVSDSDEYLDNALIKLDLLKNTEEIDRWAIKVIYNQFVHLADLAKEDASVLGAELEETSFKETSSKEESTIKEDTSTSSKKEGGHNIDPSSIFEEGIKNIFSSFETTKDKVNSSFNKGKEDAEKGFSSLFSSVKRDTSSIWDSSHLSSGSSDSGSDWAKYAIGAAVGGLLVWGAYEFFSDGETDVSLEEY